MRDRRVCLLAVGNPHHADDSAGPAVVRRLIGHAFPASLVDAGLSPEDYLGAVRAAQPEVVLIIDAIDLHAQAGDVALLRPDQLRRNFGYSHHGSLRALASLLINLAGAQEVLILGIQPGTLSRFHSMSESVERTVESIVEMLCRILPDTRCGPVDRFQRLVPGRRSQLSPAARHPSLLTMTGGQL
jgi:hydrogenase 3 maturation protease